MEEKIDDFNAIITPGSAEAKDKVSVRVGKLPDGRYAVVRGSREGSPTLEIQRAGDNKPVIKIRYRKNQPE